MELHRCIFLRKPVSKNCGKTLYSSWPNLSKFEDANQFIKIILKMCGKVDKRIMLGKRDCIAEENKIKYSYSK